MEGTGLTFFLTIIALVFATRVVIVAPQEVEDESEFSYVKGSNNGPQRWSRIREQWRVCNHGRMQSPIDIVEDDIEAGPGLGRLRQTYWPAPATLENRGHDIMLKWTNGSGQLRIKDTKYTLKQLHWHSPSEHTLNGNSFPLELHMVHQSEDKKIAVVGIFYIIGHPDPFLSQMEEFIHKLKNDKAEEEDVGFVDPRNVQLGSPDYYRYIGSLTTPPCTEGVIWTIMKEVRTVSMEQIQLLRDAVNDNMENNARPVQPINNRRVEHYYRRR